MNRGIPLSMQQQLQYVPDQHLVAWVCSLFRTLGGHQQKVVSLRLAALNRDELEQHAHANINKIMNDAVSPFHLGRENENGVIVFSSSDEEDDPNNHNGNAAGNLIELLSSSDDGENEQEAVVVVVEAQGVEDTHQGDGTARPPSNDESVPLLAESSSPCEEDGEQPVEPGSKEHLEQNDPGMPRVCSEPMNQPGNGNDGIQSDGGCDGDDCYEASNQPGNGTNGDQRDGGSNMSNVCSEQTKRQGNGNNGDQSDRGYDGDGDSYTSYVRSGRTNQPGNGSGPGPMQQLLQYVPNPQFVAEICDVYQTLGNQQQEWFLTRLESLDQSKVENEQAKDMIAKMIHKALSDSKANPVNDGDQSRGGSYMSYVCSQQTNQQGNGSVSTLTSASARTHRARRTRSTVRTKPLPKTIEFWGRAMDKPKGVPTTIEHYYAETLDPVVPAPTHETAKEDVEIAPIGRDTAKIPRRRRKRPLEKYPRVEAANAKDGTFAARRIHRRDEKRGPTRKRLKKRAAIRLKRRVPPNKKDPSDEDSVFNFQVEHMHRRQNGDTTAAAASAIISDTRVCQNRNEATKSPTLDTEPEERKPPAKRRRGSSKQAKIQSNCGRPPKILSGDPFSQHDTSFNVAIDPLATMEAAVDTTQRVRPRQSSSCVGLSGNLAQPARSATDADEVNVASLRRSIRKSVQCGRCNMKLPEKGHSSFRLLVSSSFKYHHTPTNYRKHALCTTCYKQCEKDGWLTNDRRPRLGGPWLEPNNYPSFSFIHQYKFQNASMQEYDMCTELRQKDTPSKPWTEDIASNMVPTAVLSSPPTDLPETIPSLSLPETTPAMGRHNKPHRQTVQELAAEGVKRVPFDVVEVDMDYPVLFEGSYEHFYWFGRRISSVHEAIMNLAQHDDSIKEYQELITEFRSPECFCTECIKDPKEKKVHGYLAKITKKLFLNRHQDQSMWIPRSLRLKNMTNLAMMFLNIDRYICQCHYDPDTSVLTVVTGSKTVYLRRDKVDIPEDAERRLKIDPSKMTDEDRLEQGWMKVVVNAGESLLIPKFWAHQVESAPHTSALGLCVASASI